MICKDCSAICSDDAIFCHKCGSKLESDDFNSLEIALAVVKGMSENGENSAAVSKLLIDYFNVDAIAAESLALAIWLTFKEMFENNSTIVAMATGSVEGNTENVSTSDEDPLSELPISIRNAIISALNYINVGGYSRSGLINQLEFEGFSTYDSTIAVDSIDVDWNDQAAISARSYMSVGGYSRKALIEQLEFEGFTESQALYGVLAVGY